MKQFKEILPMVIKIISGGQTGADQGALAAAKELGIPTGGAAPKGYRTDDGPNLDLCLIYGLEASIARNYGTRTKENVIASDGTLIFGNINSAGCTLTKDLCIRYNKPLLHIDWYANKLTSIGSKEIFIGFLSSYNYGPIKILNVAGNRERLNPGIFQATKDFLIDALRGISS